MRVRVVDSEDDIDDFKSLPFRLYEKNPFWVSQVDNHLEDCLKGEAPFSDHCVSRGFLLEFDGAVVARLFVQIDLAYNKHWNEKMGHFFFFEAAPGIGSIVGELFEEGFKWLSENGVEEVRLSYLHGRQLPLTIDAYDAVPTVFHTYNPPYYHGYVKIGGFEVDQGFSEHRIDLTQDLIEYYKKKVEVAEKRGCSFRSLDVSQIERDTRLLLEIHNLSFSNHWGAVQLNYREALAMTEGAQDLIDPDFIVFAEKEGETFAFMYGLPDLNQAFSKMGRTIGVDEVSDFLEKKACIDNGLLLVGGVKPNFQDSRVGQAMGSWIMCAMWRKGYKSVSPTIIMDSNFPARRYMEKLGSRPIRNFVTYRKILRR